MDLPVRDLTHWATGYGLPRTMLKLLARQGDPMAKLLTIDSNPVDDIYPLIEQVRARGRMSRVPGAGWVSADMQILREVLRDSRIRTAKPNDRSPFRLGQWILAKTDPDVMNPIVNFPIGGRGTNGGWFGWSEDARIEQLKDQFVRAPSSEGQKKIAEEIQQEAYDQVIYIPLGQFFAPSVWRKSLTGVLDGPATPVFWNVEKAE